MTRRHHKIRGVSTKLLEELLRLEEVMIKFIEETSLEIPDKWRAKIAKSTAKLE